MKKHRNVMALFLVSLLMATSQGCTGGQKGGDSKFNDSKNGSQDLNDDTTELERSRIPVQTDKVVLRNIQNTYRASSVLQAERDVEILVKEEGTISSVNFLAGDQVKAGQVIAKISAPVVNSRLNKAKLNYADKQRHFKASQELFDKKHIARDRFEESRIELESAKISFQDAERAVANLTLKAPFDGQIVNNYLQVGAHSSTYTSTAPVRIVADKNLKSTFSIPIFHLNAISVGMNLRILTRGISGSAVVTRLSPIVDKDTGTVLIYFDVGNSAGQFLSGERVSLEVPLGEASERLILPENSVIFEGDRPYVYIARKTTPEELEKDIKNLMGDLSEEADKGDFGQNENSEESNQKVIIEDTKNKNVDEKTADKSESPEVKQQERREKLRKYLVEVPRARKIPVAIEQMANGEYALKSTQEGEAKDLKDGSEIVVIGLYHMADDAKLKLLDNL